MSDADRALARYHADMLEAEPRAKAILAGLLDSPYGDNPPDCPESATEPPDCWPYKYLA